MWGQVGHVPVETLGEAVERLAFGRLDRQRLAGKLVGWLPTYLTLKPWRQVRYRGARWIHWSPP